MAQSKQVEDQPRKKKRRNSALLWVPCLQISDIVKRLQCTPPELADKIGISAASMAKYMREGRAPEVVMKAINGVVAESVIGGTGQIRTLPAVIPQPGRAPRRVVQYSGRECAAFLVRVPADRTAEFRALTGALGYDIEREGD